MKFIILSVFCVFSFLLSSAQQQGKATVTVLNEEKSPVENATVELLRSKDSVLVKTAISDKSGVAEFDKLSYGNYLARITSVGYKSAIISAISITEGNTSVSIPATLAGKTPSEMQSVTVTAKKPFIQKLSDRIVVNVENSVVNAGSTALDVLERSPGITVDQNDAISLRGRAGVIIMIDGKPSPMSGADLANYLRNLPSNAIDRIEIITNPSARYDASGNSGIIDIRMKKDQRMGTNGTFNVGYGQGVYPKANAGVTLNYRNKKVNMFGNYNYSYREHLNHLIINRNFFNNGVFQGSDDKDNYTTTPVTGQQLRFGTDFFPSKNTIIGFVVNSNFSKIDRFAEINTVKNSYQNKPVSKFYSTATNDDHSKNAIANINLKQTFAKGKELTADADYGVYKSSSLTRTVSSFFNLDGSRRRADDILDGDQNGTLKLRTAKADYTNPLRKGEKFEAGFKTSYVSSDNDAKFFNVTSRGSEVDGGKTNRFFYKEYNNAGYINYARELKKFSVQFGLRGENTDLQTRQVKGNKTFSKSYFELFPSAFFNYKLKEDKTVGISVSRRIDRPGYFQLNPFLFQVDANIYSTGDPLLKPQMTWSYEMNYTVKNLNFTLGYSHTKDPQSMVLSKILDVLPNFEILPGQDSNITVQIPVNLDFSDYVGLTATLPVRINKWWNMINNLNAYYSHFSGNLGGTPLDNGAPAVTLRTNNTFSFKKGWSAELNANYFTSSRQGYMTSNPQWGVAVGAQKNIMKGKGTLRFNMTDIFWTNLPNAVVSYPGSYVENWHAYRESRVANFSFTYRFGNNKVQPERRRKTASEEERQRAG